MAEAITSTSDLKPASPIPYVTRFMPFIGKLLFAGAMAYGVAQYRAGQNETRTDIRIGSLEQKVEAVDSALVPRRENEARWAAIEASQMSISVQLRDVQTTQTQILLQLSHLNRIEN